jgi:exopolysaccharide biosynthesis polyprenyl glycosylphosphotransferase
VTPDPAEQRLAPVAAEAPTRDLPVADLASASAPASVNGAKAARAAPAEVAIVDPAPSTAAATLTRRRRVVRAALVAADFLALVATAVLVHALAPADVDPAEAVALALAFPAFAAAAGLAGLYEERRLYGDEAGLDELPVILNVVTLAVWAAFAASVVTDAFHPDRKSVVLYWGTALLAIPLARVVARRSLQGLPGARQRTVVVGAGIVGQEIARKLRAHDRYGADVIGFLDADPLPLHASVSDVPILGTPRDLAGAARTHGVERVVIAFTADGHEATLDMVRACNDLDIKVDVVPRLFEVVGARAQFQMLQGSVLVGLKTPQLRKSHRIAKRAMDVVGAAAGLAVLAPLLAAVAVAVKLTSPGPVFFRQPRIGRGQRPFTILKFRTMVEDADQRKAEVAHLNAHLSLGDARMFKIPDDPRVTALGQILRRLSIDELPQLWNVLRGDMSLVGPRPLILDEHQYVTSWGLRRLDLTPGLTGLWQVCGRSEIPFSQMLVLDYLYVTNWSLWGDIKLVFRTIPVLVGKSRGAV